MSGAAQKKKRLKKKERAYRSRLGIALARATPQLCYRGLCFSLGFILFLFLERCGVTRCAGKIVEEAQRGRCGDGTETHRVRGQAALRGLDQRLSRCTRGWARWRGTRSSQLLGAGTTKRKEPPRAGVTAIASELSLLYTRTLHALQGAQRSHRTWVNLDVGL